MNKKDVLGSRPAAWNASKMKSIPIGKSRFCAKSGICFSLIKCLFWWYLRQISRRRIFLLFQYVYSTDFCRGLNLQIDCIFVMFDIKMISNVAQATFCKVFLLYTNYAIFYILYSIHQQTTISSIYPYCSISYYPQYLVFNYSLKPQYIVLSGIAVPIRVLCAHTHAHAHTRTRANTFPCVP